MREDTRMRDLRVMVLPNHLDTRFSGIRPLASVNARNIPISQSTDHQSLDTGSLRDRSGSDGDSMVDLSMHRIHHMPVFTAAPPIPLANHDLPWIHACVIHMERHRQSDAA